MIICASSGFSSAIFVEPVLKYPYPPPMNVVSSTVAVSSRAGPTIRTAIASRSNATIISGKRDFIRSTLMPDLTCFLQVKLL